MKLITRDTDYAVRIVKAIALKDSKEATAAELSKELGIPLSYVRKLLQILGKRGPLRSYTGKGGGFELARPADKITLGEIAGLFQGQVCFTECLFKKKPCPERGRCAMRKKIQDIEALVAKNLDGITLASLMK
jgi:Rrf2 family protein